jgi:hypothetical protein
MPVLLNKRGKYELFAADQNQIQRVPGRLIIFTEDTAGELFDPATQLRQVIQVLNVLLSVDGFQIDLI